MCVGFARSVGVRLRPRVGPELLLVFSAQWPASEPATWRRVSVPHLWLELILDPSSDKLMLARFASARVLKPAVSQFLHDRLRDCTDFGVGRAVNARRHQRSSVMDHVWLKGSRRAER